MKTVSTLFAAGVALAALSTMAALPDPAKLPPASKQTDVTFEKDIHPIFDAECARCSPWQRAHSASKIGWMSFSNVTSVCLDAGGSLAGSGNAAIVESAARATPAANRVETVFILFV